MARSSGSDRRLRHDLTKSLRPILAGSSRADDGMDEAENVCCASSATNSEALQTLIPCMRAAAPLARSHPDCEEKRDPRDRSGQRRIKNQLDPYARLEKRTLAGCAKADLQVTSHPIFTSDPLRTLLRPAPKIFGRWHQVRAGLPRAA